MNTTRKYIGDGHLERIDPTRLQVGNVVRMPYGSGSVPTFNDAVITRIYIKSCYDTRDDKTYSDLQSALAAQSQKDYVYVQLARPYLYANTTGCVANWLVGVEAYEVEGQRMLDTHKVVVQSTGEYAEHNSR